MVHCVCVCSMRGTAESSLEHAWMVETSRGTNSTRISTGRLKQFRAKRKWKVVFSPNPNLVLHCLDKLVCVSLSSAAHQNNQLLLRVVLFLQPDPTHTGHTCTPHHPHTSTHHPHTLTPSQALGKAVGFLSRLRSISLTSSGSDVCPMSPLPPTPEHCTVSFNH